MSTWYDNYMRQISLAMAQRSSAPEAGPADIARSILARTKSPVYTAPKPVAPKKDDESTLFKITAAPGRFLRDVFSEPAEAVIDVLSRGTYAQANTRLEYEKQMAAGNDDFIDLDRLGAEARAAWRGLSGKDKTTSHDVRKFANPNEGNKTRGVNSFLEDVMFDPLNILPVGAIAKGIKKLKPATQPLETTVEKVTQGAPVPTEQTDVVTKLLESTQPTATTKTPLAIEAGSARIFEGSPTGAPSIRRGSSADEMIRQAQMSAILQTVQETPRLYHPSSLSVPSIFREVEEETIERVPREVEETIELPPQSGTARSSGKEPSRGLSRARAIKATLLNTEDYRIGKYTVGDLLKSAKSATPDQQKMIAGIIDDEVKRIAKSGDTANLPKFAKFYGRSGSKGTYGLDLDQLTDLMHRGIVGGNPGSFSTKHDDFLKQFPVHSADDLKNVFINNARGERVDLKRYLEDLGIQLKSVSKGGDVSDISPYPAIPEFNLDGPKPRTKTVRKTIYEEVPKKVTKTTRLSNAESILWAAQHAGRLSTEEITYLLWAGSPASFQNRLDDIKAVTVAGGNFQTLDELITAANDGLVPQEAIDKLLRITGASSIKDLKSKAERILNVTGPKNPADEYAREHGLESILEPPKNTSKVERYRQRPPDDDFMAPRVTPAEEIIARAEAGDSTALSRSVDKLRPEQIADIAKALPWAVVENLVDPRDLKKYPFLTDIKRSKRTDATPHIGRARNLHGWHSISQSDVFRGLIKSASPRHNVDKTLKGTKAVLAWRLRAQGLYDDVVPALVASEQALREQGVKLISGKDEHGIMLSLGDVLLSLPREVVEKHLFNPRFSVFPTEFMQAADGIIRSKMGKVPTDIAELNAYNIFKNSPKIRGAKNAEVLATALANALIDVSDVILQKVEINYARHSIQVGEAVKSMTDEVIDNVVNKYANPSVSMAEAFGDFVMRHDDISKLGRKVKAPTEAFTTAKDLADARLASVLSPGDFAEAKAAKAFAAATTEKEAAKIGVQQSRSRSSEALDIVDETVDLGERFESQLMAQLFRAHVPLLDKAGILKDALGQGFVAHYGHADLHEALRTRRSVTQDQARKHRGLIATLHDSIRAVAGAQTPEYTREAFRHLQGGTVPSDPTMLGIMEGLKSSVDQIFGASIDSMGSFLQRNGIFPAHINDVLDFYKAPKSIRFDTTKSMIDQVDAWRTWDVDDPLNTLDIMHAAMQRASVEVTLGRDFSAKFGSAVKQKDYVKITNSGERSKIGRFIDRDLYYPREIAEQLKHLDRVMQGSMSRHGSENSQALVSVLDKVTHAWKSGMTIYRPGHHVRNLIGDVTLAFFDGVTNPAQYGKAIRILSTRSKAYDSWDGLRALQLGEGLAGARSGGATGVKIAGKKQKFTDDAIWRAAYDQGIIPDYRTLEDIAFNTEQSLKFKAGKKISLTRPTGGRAQKVAGGISQSRDHMVRIAHFVDVLEKGNWKTVEEAFDAAGQRVRKWHPDGSDLTNFENSVMRRTFMFYSWMRKSIPLVMEALVMNPGKAMVFPKAMYNYALAMGVDPESISNPFPLDQLFPEFISDTILGPQQGEAGNYTGINPGEPVTETLNEWGADPGHIPNNLAGALNPLGKVPLELIGGTQFGTGTPINDTSDYLDSQIPQVGTAARLSGHSVTGMGEPTRDVEKEFVEPGMNDTAVINFLTGLGIRDYSKPNYISRAELELRDKLREARNG